MADFSTLLDFIAPYLRDPMFFAIAIGGAVLLALVGGLSVFRAIFHAHSRESKAFHKIILLIRVPK